MIITTNDLEVQLFSFLDVAAKFCGNGKGLESVSQLSSLLNPIRNRVLGCLTAKSKR